MLTVHLFACHIELERWRNDWWQSSDNAGSVVVAHTWRRIDFANGDRIVMVVINGRGDMSKLHALKIDRMEYHYSPNATDAFMEAVDRYRCCCPVDVADR